VLLFGGECGSVEPIKHSGLPGSRSCASARTAGMDVVPEYASIYEETT
jgi:hypothetical protein